MELPAEKHATLGNRWDGKPLRLHASFIQDWIQCRARGHYKYVQRLPDPTSLYAGNGQATHTAVAALHQSRIDGVPLHWTAMEQVYTEEFYGNLYRWKLGAWDQPDKLYERTLAGLQLYYEEHAPAVKPAAVERWLNAELRVDIDAADKPPNAPRLLIAPYTGRADLIDKQDRVVDFKLVAGQTPDWGAMTEAAEFQVIGYSMLWELEEGRRPSEGRYDYLLVPSRGRPQVVPLAVQITDEKVERFTRLACQVALEVYRDQVGINPAHPYCNPRGCPYWEQCHRDW